ncbi:GntR family transcriptional regulator [Streptomyces sp. NPDC059477]|uniref:GntR family transcriptional regulator n=1 Tax=Streptomyces sp. NPDC059477 TaxID=3346847 RepID=UPI00369B0FF7
MTNHVADRADGTSGPGTSADGDGIASAERVAARIRELILEGELAPGRRLREVQLAALFAISRNTLREGLRLLVTEGLVHQELHRGAVVASIDAARVRDIYRVRRVIEPQAIAASALRDDARLEALESAVRAVERAAAQKRWRDVGTASLRFHQALVSLLDSPLFDDFFSRLGAMLRLAWGAVSDEVEFERPWPQRDRELYELIRRGRIDHAQGVLAVYLDDSERMVLAVLRGARGPSD